MFVFDYIPSPSFTHTTGMTHFLNFQVNSFAVCGNCIFIHPKYKLEYTTVMNLLVA